MATLVRAIIKWRGILKPAPTGYCQLKVGYLRGFPDLTGLTTIGSGQLTVTQELVSATKFLMVSAIGTIYLPYDSEKEYPSSLAF